MMIKSGDGPRRPTSASTRSLKQIQRRSSDSPPGAITIDQARSGVGVHGDPRILTTVLGAAQT